MITNERQLQVTRSQIARFKDALAELDKGELFAGVDSSMHALQIAAARSQLESLESEVAEYERLRSGSIKTFKVSSLTDLPEALIRARIAAGLTQKDLAKRLGMREQQIQRYEASRYEGASLGRIIEVADAIGIGITNSLRLLQQATSEQLLQRLGSAGLEPAFVKRRIAPSLDTDVADISPAVSRVAKLFNWDPQDILSTTPLELPRAAAATARFKMPKGRDARAVAAYTAYAYQLARICAEAMVDTPHSAVPVKWREFREQFLQSYTQLTLENTLSFAWDLGVVVLPLNDPGTFHGAHWRIGGVNVIILKQSTRHAARWLFDLLHELYHAGQEPEARERELIELPETSQERRESDEERRAMFFAGNVSLGGRAEQLTNRAVELADGDLRRLKRAAQRVAQETRADLSLLANYIAFRLSLQGENWWGAAANMQDLRVDPLPVCRQVFFERFPFEKIESDDFELLRLALHDETENE